MDTLLDAFPILRYLLLLLYLLLLYYVSVKLEKRAWAFFDTRWLPPLERRKRKLKKGVRVLLVRDQDKQSVTLWALLKAEANLFALGIGAGLLSALAYLGGWYLGYWRTDGNIAYASLPLLVYRFLSPFLILQFVSVVSYWIAGWSSKRRRLVVTNDKRYNIRLFINFIGLLRGQAPDIVITPERTSLLKRAVSAADIQRIKPDYKTPWLRDQITFVLAGRRGVGSVLLPSEVYEDVETFEWVEDVEQLVPCLYDAADIGDEYEKSRDRSEYFGDMEMYRTYQDTDSPEQAEDARVDILDAREMFDERIAPESEIDLFFVEDPGLCISGELKLLKEELAAGTISIAPRYKPTTPVSDSPNPVGKQEPKIDEGDDEDESLPPSRLHSR